MVGIGVAVKAIKTLQHTYVNKLHCSGDLYIMQLPNSIRTKLVPQDAIAPSTVADLIAPFDPTPAFLVELLQATEAHKGDLYGVYPLLVENLDLLEANFIYVLRNWATLTLSIVSQGEAQRIADVLVDLAGIIWGLPEGDGDINLEIAIACCEIALQVYTREDYPNQWATVHQNLALAYNTRTHGNAVDNTRRAYAHYYQAQQIFTWQTFPQEWRLIPHISFI